MLILAEIRLIYASEYQLKLFATFYGGLALHYFGIRIRFFLTTSIGHVATLCNVMQSLDHLDFIVKIFKSNFE